MNTPLLSFNTSEVRSVRVIFKGDTPSIQITEAMADAFKSSGNWITLQDPVSGEILFDGSKSEIKQLQHANLKKIEQDFSSKKWICEYGIRHKLNEPCKCMEIYTCPPGYFSSMFWSMKKDLGKYPQDLMESERREIAALATDEWCKDTGK
jgi:hypothetical protein